MTMPPSPQAVLAAQSELSSVSFEIANDLYGATWLASHVRLVELLPDSGLSHALLLAHVLATNPVEQHTVEEWLPHTTFRTATAHELAQLIAHAASEVQEADDRLNSILASALARLSPPEDQPIFAIEALMDSEAGVRSEAPSSPYLYGPTYQMFWANAGRFYFLEVHQES